MEPLTTFERTQLSASGTLAERIASAKAIGNHLVDGFRFRQALNRTARRYLQSQGLTGPRLEELVPLLVPPPAWRGMPTTGSVKVFALLIEFTDYGHTNAASTIHDALFGTPSSGTPCESIAAYYRRSSFNLLDLSAGATVGWYQTNKKRSDIAQTNAGRESLIKEAIQYFHAQGHDFSQYDNNHNGEIDYFLVFWTGPDNGWANFWWGYQTKFWDPTFTVDGVRLGKYSWQWEANPVGAPFSPRVAIHETGHALGLPDLYDYDGDVGPDGGVGGLDMMDANHFDHNCFSKWMLDWLSPTIIGSGEHAVTLNPSATSGDCVAIWPDLNGGKMFSELFMLENRQCVANDSDLPGPGLVLWHIDARLDASGQDFAVDNSFSPHKYVRLMEADGREDIEANRGFDIGDYYTPGKKFGTNTHPSSARYDGQSSEVEVTDITQVGSEISCVIRVGSPRTWAFGQRINTVDSTPKAPSTCVFQNRLYTFWKSNDTGNRIHVAASNDGVNWPSGHKINTVDSTPEPVSVCIFQNKLYVFWKANDTGNRIYCSASADGISWPNAHRINEFDSSPQSVSACVFQDKLYLFWKANDTGNRIYCSASADGVSWPNGRQINTVDSTPKALSTCVFQNKLYAFWKANDAGNRIYVAASNDGVNWPSGHNINIIDSTPEAVSTCVFDNRLYVFWKANDTGNRIYVSASDDGVNWPSARRINEFDSTPQPPAAVVFSNQIHLFWKSNDPGNWIFHSVNH